MPVQYYQKLAMSSNEVGHYETIHMVSTESVFSEGKLQRPLPAMICRPTQAAVHTQLNAQALIKNKKRCSTTSRHLHFFKKIHFPFFFTTKPLGNKSRLTANEISQEADYVNIKL